MDSFQIIEIGADRADQPCLSMGNSSVLLAGDACVTVDPTTGLGCNTAIQSSVDFLDFIWDFDNTPKGKLLSGYKIHTLSNTNIIHRESFLYRGLYRPFSEEDIWKQVDYESLLNSAIGYEMFRRSYQYYSQLPL